MIFGLILSGCTGEFKYRSEEGMVWNTIYHITYDLDRDLTDSINKVFNEIDGSVSAFNPNSTVSQINANKREKTDLHFEKVYEESRRIFAASDSMFDPTLGPLITAWGFGKGHEPTADTLRLDALLKKVGLYKTNLVDGHLLFKDNPEIEFNFSALAKGYGVDCVAEMLERNGVVNYMVEIGGEIRTNGRNSRNGKWTIAVDKPDIQNNGNVREAVTTIEVYSAGIATSGNYRNYHTDAKGAVFGHTLSPKTGRPVKTDVISATVISDTSMEADAVATACMALGSEKALEMCKKLRVGVMLILDDYSVKTNKKFDSYLPK